MGRRRVGRSISRYKSKDKIMSFVINTIQEHKQITNVQLLQLLSLNVKTDNGHPIHITRNQLGQIVKLYNHKIKSELIHNPTYKHCTLYTWCE